MRLVSVVTSVRSARPRALADLGQQVVDLARRSDAPTTSGSSSPVGRTTCSTTSPPAQVELVRGRASPRRRSSGRAAPRTPRTSAAGCRAPRAAGSRTRRASSCASGRPWYMPRTCGIVTWLSSTMSSAVLGQVVHQRRRRLAGLPAGQVARVVLDAVAVARPRAIISRSNCVRCSRRWASSSLPAALELASALVELGADRRHRAQSASRAA